MGEIRIGIVGIGNCASALIQGMEYCRDTGEEEPAEEDVIRVLMEAGADMVLNYLPVGSEEATRFYAGCALRAGAGFINCIPAFVASDPEWARR
jgi:myo-inositol-1-phosphate synthase